MKFLATRMSLGAILIAALAQGCISDPPVIGSGKVMEESRNVSGFSAVNVSGSGRLFIEQTGNESLKIEADDNILPLLTSEVDGGTLRLGVRGHASIQPSKPVTYRVTVKQLHAVQLSGSADANVKSLSTDKLAVEISGSGNVTASGNADAQTVRISGSADYDGAACTGKTADVHISGSGHVIVHVADRLEVNISGSGQVDYIGHPQVTEHISGSGGVSSLGEGGRG